MSRPRPVTSVAPALVALALAVAACGGDDEEATTRPAPRDGVEAPRETTPPSAPGALPAEFVQCMADQGFEIKSPAAIHSAPPQLLQACFGSLHEGGGQQR